MLLYVPFLSPMAIMSLKKRDEEGWPHYKALETLPNLKAGEQAILMKQAVVNYFKESSYI